MKTIIPTSSVFGSYEFHLAGKMISVKIHDLYFKMLSDIFHKISENQKKNENQDFRKSRFSEKCCIFRKNPEIFFFFENLRNFQKYFLKFKSRNFLMNPKKKSFYWSVESEYPIKHTPNCTVREISSNEKQVFFKKKV